MRILGPPRSSSTPTHLSARAAASRTNASRRRRSSTIPCEAFRRTTSRPARIISVNTFRSSVDGPTVATIFVRLNMYPWRIRDGIPRSRPFDPLLSSSFFQHGDRGQRLTLDELEEGATAGRNIGNTVFDVVLLDRRQRVTATRE